MLPTLTVLLDDGTGTFPTDISRWVLADGAYSFSRGRDDWQGAVTAGELSLTLNNSTGLFTPGFVGGFGVGPFGGGLYVDQRIRVKETVNGVTYTRFTGYLKALPVAWPATVSTFATVRLTATDAQARAERRPLRSIVEEEILADSPVAYYTMGEPEISTYAGDTSGNNTTSLTPAGAGTAVTFGTGVGPIDGLTAAVFSSPGQYLAGGKPVSGTLGPSSGWSVECFINTTTATGNIVVMTGTLGVGADLTVVGGVFDSVGGATINDGVTHHIALTFDGATRKTYLDGVQVASTASAFYPNATGMSVSADASNSPVAATISHVAVYNTGLSAARIAAHSSAGRTGLAGEAGTARLTRLAGYAGVPIGTLDPSLTNAAAGTGWSGSTVGVELENTTEAEFGLTYIDGTGSLTFHNRNRNPAKTTPDLTLSSQWVTPDVSPVLDDQQIINYMEVTAEATGVPLLVRSTTSETAHGRYSGSQSYLVLTDQEALDRANWIISKFAEPTPRYGTLTINLYGMTAAQASSVIAALEPDCWLRVTMMAAQTPGGTTADVVVQGINESGTGDSWSITCNVVSRSLYTALIIDDPVFGVVDTYPVMF